MKILSASSKLLIFLFLSLALHLNAQESDTSTKTITGIISYLETPVSDVNILVKGSSRGTLTNSKGYYEIIARVGEEIMFSHVAYKNVTVIIEDVTQELNIEMVEYSNELEEVVVIIKTADGQVIKRSEKAEAKFSTSRGSFDPKTAGFAVGYVAGDEISSNYASIKEALRGKISGYEILADKAYIRGKGMSITLDYPVAWEVDGVFQTEEPLGLDLSQIANVYALKGVASTTKYGSLGAGGVIIIQTKYGTFSDSEGKTKAIADQYTNQNYYNNDAFSKITPNSLTSSYTKELIALNDKQKAYNSYINKKSQITSFSDHMAIGQMFFAKYHDPAMASDILVDLGNTHSSNPEILKAIAYQLQHIGMKWPALDLYKKIARLRPNYAQSYRDLANAYKENDQYKLSWRIYMNYLMQGNDVSDEGIGQIIYNEMEYLFYNRPSQTEIKEKFVPKNENIDQFRNDVRVVFEWNTTEAEFDLEFVNPDQRAYVFEHSYDVNQELIKNEKTIGYSSKEFLIEDIGSGEWLINLSYRGNKTTAPTYFKVTTYTNWGKANQKHKVTLYQLNGLGEKAQILKLNKQILMAAN